MINLICSCINQMNMGKPRVGLETYTKRLMVLWKLLKVIAQVKWFL